MTKQQLHNLINRYFDAETSIEEERILKSELASKIHDDPLADQARAVMGLSLASTCQQNTAKAPAGIIWRVAATLAITVAVGASLILGSITTDNNEKCVAYLNGEKISNEHQVMQLMLDDLSAMETASAEINTDITAEINEIAVLMGNMQENN